MAYEQITCPHCGTRQKQFIGEGVEEIQCSACTKMISLKKEEAPKEPEKEELKKEEPKEEKLEEKEKEEAPKEKKKRRGRRKKKSGE